MMSRKDGFRVEWSAEDGYVGKGRPQEFYVGEDDIDGSDTDTDLEKLLEDMVRDEFENRVSPSVHNTDEFMAWARAVAERKRA